jgi:hypothetical protein
MRNRAKCRLCGDIIESFTLVDLVTCKCGEISVDGGLNKYRCFANDWNNFIRVDDEGNEITIRVKDNEQKPNEKPINTNSKPSKKELLDMLDEMINSYERLPNYAKEANITNYDLLSVLLLVSSLFKADLDRSN